MSIRCRRVAEVQDLLDGLLDRADEAELRRHAATCAECSREIAAYSRLFRAIERIPLRDPGSGFTERVLAAVVPSRVRRRWLTTVGWAYSGALAACAAVVVLALRLPQTRQWLAGASDVASVNSVRMSVLAIDLLANATLAVANGWGLVTSMGQRIAPVPRTFASLLQHGPVEISLWAAGVACVALLMMLRTREAPRSRGADPLGLMGV
jgi:anti-sigma factor RsiW